MAIKPQEPESQVADEVLVGRILAKDESALAALYDRYSGIVYSVAAHVLGDHGIAEEVLQDIFYQLWRTAANFDAARGSLPAWLMVTARNRAIDRLRRRNRATQSGDEQWSNRPPAAPLNLETEMARKEAVERVRSAFAALAPSQRETIELAYFEGLTQTEIAARTREPLGTVKTRMRSGLQILREMLNP